VNSPPELTSTLLGLLGQSSNSATFLATLQALKIRQVPQTFASLKDEIEDGEFENEDEAEYELTQRSKASQIIDVEKFGLVMIYQTLDEYRTNFGSAPENTDFVLKELAFYQAGVRGAMAYPQALPFGLSFQQSAASQGPPALGPLIAERKLYDVMARQYMPANHVVNASFDESGRLIHVHVRLQTLFDRCQRGELRFRFKDESYEFYTQGLGQLISAPQVQTIFEKLNVSEKQRKSAHCPEEITIAERAHGVTLHVRGPKQAGLKTSLGDEVVFVLAGVVFKRMGDLASEGYFGHLPYDLGFWMTPDQVLQKVPSRPIWHHSSEQLASCMWRLHNGQLMQAMFSLIDCQLYRLSVWAPFMAQEFKLQEK
jgi:hypothetical protein